MTRIFATYNIKGGVGKTTTAVNLAHLASTDGYRTLLWDLDPQGAASYMFRIRNRVKGGSEGLIRGRRGLGEAIKATDFDGLELLPADFRYRNMDLDLDGTKKRTRRLRTLLGQVEQDYDVIFLDCPPSISLVSENVLDAADVLLVPLIPAALSLRTLDQLETFISEFDGAPPEVVPFFSMVDRRKALHRTVVSALTLQRGKVASIPARAQIEQMAERRAPVTAMSPNGPVSEIYRGFWETIRP